MQHKFFISFLFLTGQLFTPCYEIAAENRQHIKDFFRLGYILADGKDGRVFRNWKQHVAERPIESISVSLRRVSGGDKVYVNLRYLGGKTFENGRRFYLRSDKTQTVSWNVDNEEPKKRPILLNAYKGDVFVEWVRISYQKNFSRPDRLSPRPAKPSSILSSGQGSNRPSDPKDKDEYVHEKKSDQAARRRCRNQRVRQPRFEIIKLKPSGGFFSNKFRVEGIVFGACIEEAGYYEYGRLKKMFNIPLKDRYGRYEFSLRVRTGRQAELRAFTTNGRESLILVDEELLNRHRR